MTRIAKLMCLDQLKETDSYSFVCLNPEPRKFAGNCKKTFTPTNNDISTRRSSVYWKQCGKCREYLRERANVYIEKIKNDSL